jgi:DNA-binding SARP family transcriptional activator/predicted ATPase
MMHKEVPRVDSSNNQDDLYPAVPPEGGCVVRLFGHLELIWRGQLLAAPRSATARSLLAYLALNHDRLFSRDALVGIFWPERSDVAARRALSNALWQIRNSLEETSDHLVTERDAVAFVLQKGDWLDVAAFEQRVRRCKLWQKGGALPAHALPACLSGLGEAADLYRADFFEDCYDDWALLERERLREQYLWVLEQLVVLNKQWGDYEQALFYAQRLAAVDPLRESAHRELMRLYQVLGRGPIALRQFSLLRQLLGDELGVEPSNETVALYHEIAAALEEFGPVHLPSPLSPPALHDLGQIPFVGRTDERAILLDALHASSKGYGGLVLIEGAAGVGKTRLMGEIVADAKWRGFQVALAKTDPLAESAPYQQLRDAFLALLTPLRVVQLSELVDPLWLSALAPVFPILKEYLPDLPVLVPLGHPGDQQRLWEGLSHFLVGLASVTPLLIVLEDIHWADVATLTALSHLSSRLPTNRVLVVLTCRTAKARERSIVWEALVRLNEVLPCARINLSPFGLDEATSLILRALGTGPSDTSAVEFARLLYEEVAGNALFLVETLKSLLEQGFLTPLPGGGWVLPETLPQIPSTSIQDLVGQRLIRLTPTQRSILELAAVLGEEASFSLLAHVSMAGPADLTTWLGDLCRRGFLVENDVYYHLEHDLMRETIYRVINPQRRRTLHQRARAAFEALHPGRVEVLAHHAFAGGEWERAAHYYHLTADRAAAIGANPKAAEAYGRALEALDQVGESDPERQLDLLLARERVNNLYGARQDQYQDLVQLDEMLAGWDGASPVLLSKVAYRWAMYHSFISDYPAAIAAAQKAVDWAAKDVDQSAEALGYLAWGRTLWLQGDYSLAREHYQNALSLAQSAGNRDVEAKGLHYLGIAEYDLCNYQVARDLKQQALEIYHSLGNREREAAVLNSLGNICNDLGEFEASLEYYERSIAIKREIGDRNGEAHGLYNLSVRYRDQGEGELARQHCEQALGIARDTGELRLQAYALTYLGLILEQLHSPQAPSMADLDTARSYYAQALEIRRRIGQPALAVDSLAGLARVALAKRDLVAACEATDEALSWIEENGIAGIGDVQLVYLTAYRVLGALGEERRAQAVLVAAYGLLLEWADKLPDTESRQALLREVWPHHEIVAAYQAMQAGEIQSQVQICLPRIDAPTGRPLHDNERVEVSWTIAIPEDNNIPNKGERRRHRLLRLLREAADQGAAPTVSDLAKALDVTPRTIKRDLAVLREAGYEVVTRSRRSP